MKPSHRRFMALPLVLMLSMFAAIPAAAQMQMKEGMQMEMGKKGIYEGQGKVVVVVPEKNQIVLQHGEIKGFMGPMTMGYALASQSLAKGLKAGDPVKFRIDAAKNNIVAIERLPK